MPETALGSVLDALEHHAGRDPDRPFVIDLGDGAPRTWSYAEALEDIDRVAGGLSALGVRPGDRVAMRLANSWSFVSVLFGALRLGAIAVPTIRQYSPDELRHALAHSGAVCLVLDDEADEAERLVRELPEGVTAISADGALPGVPAPRRPPVLLRKGDDAMLFYTSGTTSRPKGVVLTHGAILDSCLISAEGLRLRPADRGLIVLPLFHCNALFMQLVPLLLAGGTAVIANRFSASGYLDLLRRYEITHANVTAGALRSVLAQLERREDRDHSVRLLTFALPLHREEIARFEARFGMPTSMAYGLTESCCGGTRTPAHVDPRSGWQSLGQAQSGWTVEILGDDGRSLPDGEIGEIVLRGPGLMDRYWDDPEATAAAKRGDRLHTGDLGTMDEYGFGYFHSRMKDMLKPKGENVAASEIEEVLAEHPAVEEAAVVGIFDAHQEERIVAFISGSGGARDGNALRAHCRERLAAFKVPSEFHWLDALPHTSIGKVNKGELRAHAAAALDAPPSP